MQQAVIGFGDPGTRDPGPDDGDPEPDEDDDDKESPPDSGEGSS